MMMLSIVTLAGVVALCVALTAWAQPPRSLSDVSRDRVAPSVAQACGAWLRRRAGRLPDADQDRLVGWLLAVVFCVGIAAPVVTPFVMATALFVSIAASRRRSARRRAAIARQLPEVVDLYAAGVHADLGSSAIITLTASRISGLVVDELVAAERAQRLGRSWTDVLSEVSERLGPASRAFIEAIEAYETHGVRIGASLVEIASALRDDQRRLGETAARRLPVQMLFPLIVCVLPAFLILTVAPIIADAFSSLQQ